MNSIVIYGSRYGSTKRYAEVRALIATYGKQVDFVNLDTLEPIVKAL